MSGTEILNPIITLQSLRTCVYHPKEEDLKRDRKNFHNKKLNYSHNVDN